MAELNNLSVRSRGIVKVADVSGRVGGEAVFVNCSPHAYFVNGGF